MLSSGKAAGDHPISRNLPHLIFASVRTETGEAPDFDITNLSPYPS
jgi:hypothetical protein